jgi:hypothetical protein
MVDRGGGAATGQLASSVQPERPTCVHDTAAARLADTDGMNRDNHLMPQWLAAVLPVASALLGVVIANRASTRRDTVARLWQHRTKTYMKILDWTFTVEKAVADETGRFHDWLEPRDFDGVEMPDQLLAQIWAFASEPVRHAQGPCRLELFLLSQGADKEPDESGFSPYEEHGRNLMAAIFRLRNTIREELRNGSLRIPVTFQVRQLIFSASRKKRYLRTWLRGRRNATQHLEDPLP